MRMNILIVAAFSLAATNTAALAGESSAPQAPQPVYKKLERDANTEVKTSHALQIESAPVSTETIATLQADGRVELRCNEVHEHAQHQHQSAEKLQ
jgi:hypothetical protein